MAGGAKNTARWKNDSGLPTELAARLTRSSGPAPSGVPTS
jgi:hypothetical protein